MTQPIWLGIDFGTCRSSAAVLIGGELRQVSLSFGAYDRSFDMPTAVYMSNNSSPEVGDAALEGRILDPSRYFDRFKLHIGADIGPGISVHGTEIRWRDLVVAVLLHIRRSAERQFNNNRPVTHAAVGVPAIYVEDGPQWKVMQEAARQAGFETIKLIREPHAAAIYYDHVLRKGGTAVEKEGAITLVYDLGGGTFDPALIRRRNDSYEILGAIAGQEGVRCGGVFFDEKIRADFQAKCPKVKDAFVLPVRNPQGLYSADDKTRLRNINKHGIELEKFLLDIKHRFADPNRFEVDAPEPVLCEYNYRLTRAEFYNMIGPMLDDTMEACRKLVAHSGVQWKQISRMVMVGGSCHIPLVRQKLEALANEGGTTGIEICWTQLGSTDRLMDPLLAVSLGAALSNVASSPPPPPPPTPSLGDHDLLLQIDRIIGIPKETRHPARSASARKRSTPEPQRRSFSIDLLKKELQSRFSSMADTYLTSNIPSGKLATARKIYASWIYDGDQILMLYDDTVFGGAKEGFIVTSRGIGCKSIGNSPQFWTFSQFSSAAYRALLGCVTTGSCTPMVERSFLDALKSADLELSWATPNDILSDLDSML